MCTYMYMCVCVYDYIYIYMYIYTLVYIYIYNDRSGGWYCSSYNDMLCVSCLVYSIVVQFVLLNAHNVTIM